MTNESALLGLLADLYRQVLTLQAENAQLKQQLAAQPAPPVL